MKRKALLNHVVLCLFMIVFASCQEEPLQITSGPSPCLAGCPPEDDPLPPTGCNGVDFVIQNVEVSYGTNTISHKVYVKNIGNTTAYLTPSNYIWSQAWYSTWGSTQEVPACGSSLVGYQTIPVAPGQIVSYTVNCGILPQPYHNYLIVKLYTTGSLIECKTNNNTFVVRVR